MRCRAFTFWLNLDWFLFIFERFIVKNPLRFYRQKICSTHYLHFSFEKNVPFQVLKDFSVENLETTLSTLLSKFSSKIYLSRIINYRGSIFALYLTRSVQFGLCSICFFFLYFVLLFFVFLSAFSLTDTNDSQNGREKRGHHYFSCFPLLPAHEYSFSWSKFLPLLFHRSFL